MATQAAIRELIITHTNRPDLESEMNLAISKALREIHYSSFFWWDKVEGTVTLDPVNQLNYVIDLPCRFRKFKYLNLDADRTRTLGYLDPNGIFDDSVYTRMKNFYYLGGSVYNVRFSAAATTLYYGYYQIPSLADSWVANNHPEELAALAAAIVLGPMEGEDEKAARLKEEAKIFKDQLKQSYFDL